MKKTLIVRNVALMAVFAALGLALFNEEVRTVQIIRLFASGVGFGAALTVIIHSLRSRKPNI